MTEEMELNKIYNEDCLDGMAKIEDGIIDCCVTSPPYNKGGEGKNGGKLVTSIKYSDYSDDMDEAEYQDFQVKVLNQIARVLKKDGSLFYNHKNRYLGGRFISPLEWIMKSDLQVRQEIVWDRIIAGNIRGWRYWNTDERIYWLQRKDATQKELSPDFARFGSVWRIMPEMKKNGHPCPFPQKLPDICISSVCKEGDIVLDPFMGSGTVAISAINNKCNFIGFELSAEYISFAESRIALMLSEPALF